MKIFSTERDALETILARKQSETEDISIVVSKNH
jgi:hypothetical protein